MLKTGIALITSLNFYFGSAQVGINVPAPSANAILDLSNALNQPLVLPNSNGVDPIGLLTFDEPGMVFYYGNYLYLSTGALATDKKVISPWDFQTTPTPAASVGPTTPVGIGLQPISNSPIRVVVATGGTVNLLADSATMMIGSAVNAPHLMFGRDEILAKTATGTAGTFKLQEDAGTWGL